MLLYDCQQITIKEKNLTAREYPED